MIIKWFGKLKMGKYLILFVLIWHMTGCQTPPSSNQIDRFYKQFTVLPKDCPSAEPHRTRTLTFSATDLPLSALSLYFSALGINFAISDDLSKRTLTMSVKDIELSAFLDLLSHQYQCEYKYINSNTIYVGKLSTDQRALLYLSVYGGYSEDELSKLLTPLLGDGGRLSVVGSRVLLSSSPHRLQEIASLLEGFNTRPQSYVVQYYIVSINLSALGKAGLQVVPSGTIAYDIAKNRIVLDDFNLKGLLELSADSNIAKVYTTPLSVVESGYINTWLVGQTVPIAKKSTSQYGTVTTEGYQDKDTGFKLTSVVRTVDSTHVLIRCTVEDSVISSYVESNPVLSRANYSTQFTAELDKIYLIGQYDSLETQKGISDVLSLSGGENKRTVQIWAQIRSLGEPLPLPQ